MNTWHNAINFYFQVSYDHCSYERNLSNCVQKPEKVRTSTGFEAVTSWYRCNTLTNWAMKPLALGASHLWVLISPWGIWNTHMSLVLCKILRIVGHFSSCTTNQPQIFPFKILLKWLALKLLNIILQAEELLKGDWLRPEVFQPNLKYLCVKITVIVP